MVWFYQEMAGNSWYGRQNFQSHYGLILSQSISRNRISRRVLSIPLWSDFIAVENDNVQRQQFSFNPTMVWFYLLMRTRQPTNSLTLSIPLWSDFIRLRDGDTVPVHPRGFQSHYGLILSTSARKSLKNFTETFNPTIGVRKWGWEKLSIPLWSDFIISLMPQIRICRKTFNPTMVWFYRAPDLPLQRYGNGFQSHYGLILSYLITTPSLYICSAFNPTMVWFYHQAITDVSRDEVNFQSHYGLILS